MRSFFFASALVVSSAALAWSNHHDLTLAILSQVPAERAKLTYVPLELALARGLTTVKARRLDSFRTALKINHGYTFPNKLGEKNGREVDALDLLSTYSDEPDWGGDQNLFNKDQYPELWTKDSPYVTGRTGLASQAFRHMYFPGRFQWLHPLDSLQIPMHPLGEAPARAALYYDLARDFFQHGQPYWAYRFLAWTLHIVEDLFQPFHTRQTPSKSFISLKWNGWRPGLDIPTTVERVSYYHLGFEKWVEGAAHETGGPLQQALMGRSAVPALTVPIETYLATKVVDFSGGYASRVAKICRPIFPTFDPGAGEPAEKVVSSPQWAQGLMSSPDLPHLIEITAILFKRMGDTVRRVVQDALPPSP